MTRIFIALVLLAAAAQASGLPRDYKGKPFRDDRYKSGPQVIPGVIQCAYYDLGGEGVAYHDTDAINHGSGELNHTPGHCEPGVPEYICYFREKEGVDISYTKSFADFSHPNLFDPPKQQLYIGWEADGEWTNYTVKVKKAGTYRIDALYGKAANTVQFSLDNQPAASCKLPIDTGDWHKWNKAVNCGQITFPKAGLHLLTLHYNANNNLAYFDFEPVK
ncbi:MAG: carbohydrate-binding protein [Bryobacteraceae bacterium]|jgi:hypothetical protein